VPTIYRRIPLQSVGTLRFAHPAIPAGKPVAKIQLTPQMKAKAGGLPLVYDLIFPEGDVTDARPL
jgi:hypothetical protein